MAYVVKERGDVVIIEFTTHVIGGHISLREVFSEAEMSESPIALALFKTLFELIDSGRNKIVMDLRTVKFMNSSGLGLLIAAVTKVRQAGGDIRLTHLADKIQRLLAVTQVKGMINSYQTMDLAIASYAA
jgi:anti-sigma B factor antagonist